MHARAQAYPVIAMPLLSYLPGPFDLLMASHQLQRNAFSFYLSSTLNDTSSAMVIGGVSQQYYRGNFTTVPFNLLQPLLGYWAITIESISVNGQVQTAACSNCIGVVDTGTSVIAGPPAYFNGIIAATNVSADCSNIASLPPISFLIQNVNFVLTPRQYVVQLADNSCVSGLMAFDAGEGILDPLYILGDSFLRAYYSVFDRDANVVQFANVSHGDPPRFRMPDGSLW
jgi:hypothetical protein